MAPKRAPQIEKHHMSASRAGPLAAWNASGEAARTRHRRAAPHHSSTAPAIAAAMIAREAAVCRAGAVRARHIRPRLWSVVFTTSTGWQRAGVVPEWGTLPSPAREQCREIERKGGGQGTRG